MQKLFIITFLLLLFQQSMGMEDSVKEIGTQNFAVLSSIGIKTNAVQVPTPIKDLKYINDIVNKIEEYDKALAYPENTWKIENILQNMINLMFNLSKYLYAFDDEKEQADYIIDIMLQHFKKDGYDQFSSLDDGISSLIKLKKFENTALMRKQRKQEFYPELISESFLNEGSYQKLATEVQMPLYAENDLDVEEIAEDEIEIQFQKRIAYDGTLNDQQIYTSDDAILKVGDTIVYKKQRTEAQQSLQDPVQDMYFNNEIYKENVVEVNYTSHESLFNVEREPLQGTKNLVNELDNEEGFYTALLQSEDSSLWTESDLDTLMIPESGEGNDFIESVLSPTDYSPLSLN